METNEEDEIEKLALEELMKEAKSGAERAREYGALAWNKNTIVPPTNKVFLKNMLQSTLEKPKPKTKERTDFKRRRSYRSRSRSRRKSHSRSRRSRSYTKSRRSRSHSKSRRSGSHSRSRRSRSNSKSRRSRWSDTHSKIRRSRSNSKPKTSPSRLNEENSTFSQTETKKSSSPDLKRKRSHSISPPKDSEALPSPSKRLSKSESPLKVKASEPQTEIIESIPSVSETKQTEPRSNSSSRTLSAHPDKENLPSHNNRSRSRSKTKTSRRSSPSRKSSYLKSRRSRSHSRARRLTYSRGRRSRSSSFMRKQNRSYFWNNRNSYFNSRDRYNERRNNHDHTKEKKSRKRRHSEDDSGHHKSKKKSKKHKKKKKKSKSDKKEKEKVKKLNKSMEEGNKTSGQNDDKKADTSSESPAVNIAGNNDSSEIITEMKESHKAVSSVTNLGKEEVEQTIKPDGKNDGLPTEFTNLNENSDIEQLMTGTDSTNSVFNIPKSVNDPIDNRVSIESACSGTASNILLEAVPEHTLSGDDKPSISMATITLPPSPAKLNNDNKVSGMVTSCTNVDSEDGRSNVKLESGKPESSVCTEMVESKSTKRDTIDKADEGDVNFQINLNNDTDKIPLPDSQGDKEFSSGSSIKGQITEHKSDENIKNHNVTGDDGSTDKHSDDDDSDYKHSHKKKKKKRKKHKQHKHKSKKHHRH